ncbi:Holliday junction ATP-dependent DNA helicase RuvA [Bienertia sinuspersici]
MVRTCHVLSDRRRIINKIDSLPIAGIFTKIPNKPTNHSKFTGKCGKVNISDCHLHPVSKSKLKSKGAQKLKTFDSAAVNHQLNALQIDDFRNFGYSASRVLHDLEADYHCYFNHHDDYDDVHDDHDGEHEEGESVVETMINDDDDDKDDKDDVIIHVGVTDDGDDGYMGFYDVAYLVNSVDVDEEGWLIIGGN